ncbi:MAG: septum formation initiator family protein [Treponema sp.]|jgi:cell division protein FtsB|nr:septum formation initiator family protein [Treponema sp.]
MGSVKYLIPIWVGVFVYTLFSIIRGPVGVLAYNQLSREHDNLSENMESLKRINKELEMTRDALMYDKETIAIYARDLGYSARNERFIRIVGLEGTKKPRIEAGEVLIAVEPRYVSDTTIKIVAFSIGAGLFLCMWIPDFLENKQNRRRNRKTSRPYAEGPEATGPQAEEAPFYRRERYSSEYPPPPGSHF